MPAFVVCIRHTPESRPTFNEDVKKKFGAVVGKRQEVAGKQEVKILSAYTSTLDHLALFILEAPSQQAVENYFTEIGFAFWNSVEIRQVKPVEDVKKKVPGE